ncbi:MAG: hypothetical protein LH614_20155 [Pyrinomonadaceae bacterium]|nr:hypothetical protein [Pyrinomonadaceae bacterium]
MKKIFNLTFAFLLLAFTFSVFAQDESRASKTWEVQKYNVAATLPPTETDRYLTVKANLDLKNVGAVAGSRLTLRISDKAEVSAVRVNNAAADFTKGEEKIGGNRNLQRIIVRVPSVQPSATFNVAVDYKLKTDENSGLNALSPIGSQFLPLSFWYPTPNSWYFARGADYAPFNLRVETTNGETIISSGASDKNSFEQKLFGQPFFIAGNWDTSNIGGVAVSIQKGAGAEENKRANEIALLASEAKNFTANLLGTAPDVPLRIVAVKRGAGFSSGGTIFIDESALRRQKLDSQTVMSVAEAVAKIWIGSAVIISSGDGQGAVSEGLPRFIATQFLEKQYGKEIADIERQRQRIAYAAIVKRDAPLTIVSPIDDYYYAAVANKGAMIWRFLAKSVGQNEFFNVVQSQIKDGNLSLSEIRSSFSAHKVFLDYSFEQVTEMNLLIGLPQVVGGEAKLALRNLGAIDALINIVAITQTGEKLTAQSTVRAKSFGEIIFKTTNKIVRAEIDTDKFYPQTDYADDIVPSKFSESDAVLTVKRSFDQQNYAKAEENARIVLQFAPRFDDIRTWLGRALSAQGKTAEAEKEFRSVVEEKLPTARSLAWANVGLGEIALKNDQNVQAAKFFDEAIKADAEYGAMLAARQGRIKANFPQVNDESIKAFFTQFDKAAVSGRKADLDNLIASGEIPRFSGGVAGAQEWQTKILQIDKNDLNTALVEVNLNIKLLNKNPESGTAVFRLSKVGNNWKLSSIEMFEVK